MLNQEIYILTKHGKFQAEYIENLPIYRRRYFLELFEKEREQLEEEYKKLDKKSANFKRKPRI